MLKDPKQTAKLLFIYDIFKEKCDEDNPLTVDDIKKALSRRNISLTKDESVKDAITALSEGYGLSIEHRPHTSDYYYKRDYSLEFEPIELQLLVDCVLNSKFLTEDDTESIIKKLLPLISEENRRGINSFMKPTKNTNPYSLENLKIIRTCIINDHQIAFEYGQYNTKKELENHGGTRVLSPLALIYNDDNYYLIGWSEDKNSLRTYRVDRIMGPAKRLDERRVNTARFKDTQKKYYTQNTFHMYSGSTEKITLLCENSSLSAVIDQFGYKEDIQIVDDNHFTANVNVSLSQQFIGWVIGLGGSVKITAPQTAVDQMLKTITMLSKEYNGQKL